MQSLQELDSIVENIESARKTAQRIESQLNGYSGEMAYRLHKHLEFLAQVAVLLRHEVERPKQ